MNVIEDKKDCQSLMESQRNERYEQEKVLKMNYAPTEDNRKAHLPEL